jgi:hypothetical protein
MNGRERALEQCKILLGFRIDDAVQDP